MLKATQDTVWHASALEGIATVSVVDAWSSSQTVRRGYTLYVQRSP